eukprot:3666556-Pleurochrysis_carterae.AAC.1
MSPQTASATARPSSSSGARQSESSEGSRPSSEPERVQKRMMLFTRGGAREVNGFGRTAADCAAVFGGLPADLCFTTPLSRLSVSVSPRATSFARTRLRQSAGTHTVPSSLGHDSAAPVCGVHAMGPRGERGGADTCAGGGNDRDGCLRAGVAVRHAPGTAWVVPSLGSIVAHAAALTAARSAAAAAAVAAAATAAVAASAAVPVPAAVPAPATSTAADVLARLAAVHEPTGAALPAVY